MVDVRTNLLKNRQTLSEKDYQRERMLLKRAVFGLVVVVVVVVALSAWNLVLTMKLSGIEKSLTTVSGQMQGLTKASAQQVYLKSRLKLVTAFLADRSLTRESLQKVFSTDIEGVHVGGMGFPDESTMRVQYEADSVLTLEELLRYYEADNGYFTQVVSSGITRDKKGLYLMPLSLTLPKGSK